MRNTAPRSFHGVVRERTVVFERDPGLPDGTPVVVTPARGMQGTAEAVGAAARSGPHVGREDVAELLDAIRKGRRPVNFKPPVG